MTDSAIIPFDEPFPWTRQPANAPRPVTFDDQANQHQKRLFAGADCLAGQQELFNPNGPKEKS